MSLRLALLLSWPVTRGALALRRETTDPRSGHPSRPGTTEKGGDVDKSQAFAQWLMALFVAASFFGSLWTDFNGRPAKRPYGFTGCMVTLVVCGLFFWSAWHLHALPFSGGTP